MADTSNPGQSINNPQGKSVEEDTSKAHEFKDVDGNVVDAPVIQSFEQELTAARDSADDYAIADVTDRYYKARKDKQKNLNDAESKRRKG